MKALYIQHVPFEGPAYIRDICHMHAIILEAWPVFQDTLLPRLADYNLIFIMGGPMGVYDDTEYPWLKEEKKYIEQALHARIPIIGICLGAQLIAEVFGARIYRNKYKEIGWFPVMKTAESAAKSVFHEVLPPEFYAFHWHGDTFELPQGAVHLAQSKACRNQAFVCRENVLGFQFHLESTAESIEELYQHACDEVEDAPYVQDTHQILSTDHIKASNILMRNIIEKIAGLA
jgi:GMP synthase-like glutamine amidotransferase